MSAKSDIANAQKNIENIDFFSLFHNQDSADAISELEEAQDNVNDTYEEVKKEKKKESREENALKKQRGKAREKTIDDIEAIKPPEAEAEKPQERHDKGKKPKEKAEGSRKPQSTEKQNRKFRKKENIGREMDLEEAKKISRREGLKLMVAIPIKKEEYMPEDEAPDKTISLVNISTGEVIEIKDAQFIIGKDTSCDISMPDDIYVSRTHGRIYRLKDIFYIEDLSSTNGTFLNGERLKPNNPRAIKAGDSLRIADVKFKVEE